jgi:hypothetical protein
MILVAIISDGAEEREKNSSITAFLTSEDLFGSFGIYALISWVCSGENSLII